MSQEQTEGSKTLTLRRRILPEITDQGKIMIETNHKNKSSLSKIVNMIVFVEHGKGDIPNSLEVIKEFGEQSFQCDGVTYEGNAYSISGIGQEIRNWVKSINDIWITTSIPAPVWHRVMSET